MVLSCIQLNIDESLQKKDLTTDDFHFLMTKHTQQLSKIEQMIVEQRVGLILIKAQQFHDSTIPYPKHVIQTIGKYLPPVAIVKNERMQKTIRVRNKKFYFYIFFFFLIGSIEIIRS
jgi:hypothetical protein